MTLAQLAAFVMVARLGSVKEAADALGISASGVSQALRALRRHLDDPLIEPLDGAMRLTEGGRRLLPLASQMLNLGRQAGEAVRHANDATEHLRIIADPLLAEFCGPTLVDAFTDRSNDVVVSLDAASPSHMKALLLERGADIALGPKITDPALVCEPILRFEQIIVTAPSSSADKNDNWLVGPSSNDPESTVGTVMEALGIDDDHVRVFPSQAAAWNAVADGEGMSSAPSHLVRAEVDAGRLTARSTARIPENSSWFAAALSGGRCSSAATRFLQFVRSPVATKALLRPDQGVSPSRFRPPVHVSIWSRDLHGPS